MRPALALAVAVFCSPALAQSPWDLAKKVAGDAATSKLQAEINKRLLAEARKNQCSFKSGTAELEPGCDPKAKKLATVLVEAKKQLNAANVQNFKFVVSGHTDSSGDAEKNKALSGERAQVMVKQLVSKGIPEAEIEGVGLGSDRMLVKPDDTPAKKAKNRRYEVEVKL